MLDSDIAVLGPPEHFEPLPKRKNAGQHFRIVLDVWMEECDATHATRLLRARRYRPCRRGAEYDFYDFGSHGITFIDSDTGDAVGVINVKQTIQTVKLGFSFRYMSSPPPAVPVVAKY
jgi:hypothetical protein